MTLFEKLCQYCVYSVLITAICLLLLQINFIQTIQTAEESFQETPLVLPMLIAPSKPAFCNESETFSVFDEIGFPFAAVERGVSYVGSGCRLRRVLSRAQLGVSLKVGMIGGSISALRPLYNYGTVFTDWLNKVFPTTQGPHVLINGAIRATGSSYFSYCVNAQIGNDTDIVLIDLAVNDYSADSNIQKSLLQKIQKDMLPDEETLIRTLLSQSNGPAIIFVHFGRLDHASNFKNAAAQLDMLAQFYDLSSVSYKQMMVSARTDTNFNQTSFLSRPWSETIGWDALHPAPSGYKLAGYLLVFMIQQHVLKCRTREYFGEWNITLSPDARNSALEPTCDFQLIDRHLLTGFLTNKFDLLSHAPVCMSVQGVHPNLQPTEVKGDWQLFTVPSSNKTYWRSVKPGNESLITFSIKPKQKSKVFLYTLMSLFTNATVDCWLDNYKNRVVTVLGMPAAFLRENVGIRSLIGETNAGAHALRCSHTSGEDFRIIAVFHD